MQQTIVHVDAFTAQPFSGNPAGVCLLAEAASDAWMQAVAAEMNLSETAFLLPQGQGYTIRYFTPSVEVPLCGHATLASAHLLWEDGHVAPDEKIALYAKGGRLGARREGEWVCLDLPAFHVTEAVVPDGLADALETEPLSAYHGPMNGYLLELASEETVGGLAPDFSQLKRGAFGAIIVTARSTTAGRDFVSRFYAPDVGIDEDPVTGVAHCALAPFWAERLGRSELVGHQLSHRGGVLRVRALGARVEILGQAVTTIRGRLLH